MDISFLSFFVFRSIFRFRLPHNTQWVGRCQKLGAIDQVIRKKDRKKKKQTEEGRIGGRGGEGGGKKEDFNIRLI